MINKTVALGSGFSLMQSVHESNGCFWGFAALGNLVLKGPFTNYVSNSHFSLKTSILDDIRLVHVLWYDILRHYFGMILQYFEMKIK